MIVTRAVRLVRRLRFRISCLRGRLAYGKSFVIGPGAIVAAGTDIKLGDRVNIGANSTFHTDLEVGDDVMVSSNVSFIGNDHPFDIPDLTIQQHSVGPRSRVVVEGDNLIGFGVVILGNVTIGHGAIIGAGSLVTRDVPPNTVNVGSPAKTVRMRRP